MCQKSFREMNLKRFVLSNIYLLLLVGFAVIVLWYHFAVNTADSFFQLRLTQPGISSLNAFPECNDRDYFPEILQNGNYWILKNFIQAEHGNLRCYETVTYTTHAEFTFLDNVAPLVERWRAPISLAIFAPGTDFELTLQSIKFMRNCLPQSALIRNYVTFHIYFEYHDFPTTSFNFNDELYLKYANCTGQPPYQTVQSQDTYRASEKLLYPLNLGRNIARDAALTTFVFPCDIELYPSPGLANDFIKMIERNAGKFSTDLPRVYPVVVFEIENDTPLPNVKSQLLPLLKAQKLVPFHQKVCSYCHSIPNYSHWFDTNESATLDVFNVAKRRGEFAHWEPFYIGTLYEPHYDERLNWEGMRDKMTQGYAMCAHDYEFHILNNAFLIHKPGIKDTNIFGNRTHHVHETNELIAQYILPELKALYGDKDGCHV